MSRSIYRLSDIAVRAATKSVTLNDGGGLLYRATAKNAGRWVFKFTSGDPDYLARQAEKGSNLRQREMGLGAFPAVTLATAREKADAARKLVGDNLDPIEEARRSAEAAEAKAQSVAQAKTAEAMTLGRYADEHFLPSVLPNFSNPAHIQQWKATFSTHAEKLRNKPLASITRSDILDVLQPIWTVKSVTASRSRERLERLFSHAIQNGKFHHDNPASWRQFDATLPSPRKLTRGHHASLPHDQLSAFVAVLRAKQPDSMAALMLEWITLAACRTGEARFATWSEIDLKRSIWSIPAARMKMRRSHVVPITGRMVEILAEARRRHSKGEPADGDHVFVGTKGKPLTEMAALMLLRRMEPYKEFTAHGLRASFKGWAATATEFPRELIEEQLAHQLGAVEQAYMRVSAVERRRAMMEAWATHCEPPSGHPHGGTPSPTATSKRGRPSLSDAEKQRQLDAATVRLNEAAALAGINLTASSDADRKRLARDLSPKDRALLRKNDTLPAARRGRDLEATKSAIGQAVTIGRAMVITDDYNATAAARQALFKAKYGGIATALIDAVELHFATDDFGEVVAIDTPAIQQEIKTSLDEANCDPYDYDDGQSYDWLSKAFATVPGRKKLRQLIKEHPEFVDVRVPSVPKGDDRDIDGIHAIANNLSVHVRRSNRAGQRAAAAYCEAVLAFEAEHGETSTPDQCALKFAYAEAAAAKAAAIDD